MISWPNGPFLPSLFQHVADRVVIWPQQRQIKQHSTLLLRCKSSSFVYQRLAPLCTFCLSINTFTEPQVYRATKWERWVRPRSKQSALVRWFRFQIYFNWCFVLFLIPGPLTQITFFEEKKFQGRCYNCSSDCADLHTYFGRCNSIRVESGVWVIYERPNYKGFQYILSPGEYADNQQWMAFNDNVKSCRTVKNVRGRHVKIHSLKKTKKTGFVLWLHWWLRLKCCFLFF